MKKTFKSIILLVCTSVIAAIGFSACGTQKQALKEKQEQQRLAREEAERAARAEQQAREAEQRRLIEEAERRRREIEQKKLVYGPPPTAFRPNIDK